MRGPRCRWRESKDFSFKGLGHRNMEREKRGLETEPSRRRRLQAQQGTWWGDLFGALRSQGCFPPDGPNCLGKRSLLGASQWVRAWSGGPGRGPDVPGEASPSPGECSLRASAGLNVYVAILISSTQPLSDEARVLCPFHRGGN